MSAKPRTEPILDAIEDPALTVVDAEPGHTDHESPASAEDAALDSDARVEGDDTTLEGDEADAASGDKPAAGDDGDRTDAAEVADDHDEDAPDEVTGKLSRPERRAAKQRVEAANRAEEAARRAEEEAARLAAIAAVEEAERITDEARQREAARPLARIKRAVRRTMTTTVVLALLAGIALAAVFGWPALKDRYLDPIDQARDGVAALETAQAGQGERITSLEQQVGAVDSTSGAQLGEFGDNIDELRTSNAELGTQLEAAQSLIGETQSSVDTVAGRVDELDASLTAHTTRLDRLDELSAAFATELAATNDSAASQLGYLKATELLSRARLFLYQANYGLATADVTVARSELLGITDDTLDLDQILNRLDTVLTNLPDLPVAAAADLDIAWQLLLSPATAPPVAVPDAGAQSDN